MLDLKPNEYQIEQAKKFLPFSSEIKRNGLVDILIYVDGAFEWWDNIASEEYLKRGGILIENEPTDVRLFEDCLDWANNFIESSLE